MLSHSADDSKISYLLLCSDSQTEEYMCHAVHYTLNIIPMCGMYLRGYDGFPHADNISGRNRGVYADVKCMRMRCQSDLVLSVNLWDTSMQIRSRSDPTILIFAWGKI